MRWWSWLGQVSASLLARQGVAHRGGGFLFRFEDVWCDAAPLERVPELGPHERAGGEPRDPVEVALADFLHRVEVGVLELAVELATKLARLSEAQDLPGYRG